MIEMLSSSRWHADYFLHHPFIYIASLSGYDDDEKLHPVLKYHPPINTLHHFIIYNGTGLGQKLQMEKFLNCGFRGGSTQSPMSLCTHSILLAQHF